MLSFLSLLLLSVPIAEMPPEEFSARTSYYKISPDYRRCMSPLCGGYWLESINRKQTRCADGSHAERCYVAEIEWAEPWSEPQLELLRQRAAEGRLILRGPQHLQEYLGDYHLGILRALGAWEAINAQAPRGASFRVEDLGLRCLRAPCFSMRAHLLNQPRHLALSNLNLEDPRPTDEQRAAALMAAQEGQLLLSGALYWEAQERGMERGLSLVASQIYLPVAPAQDLPECVADEDCTQGWYHEFVNAEGECYCLTCPIPMGQMEEELNQASWQLHCAALPWIQECIPAPCAPPPPVGCVENQCIYTPEEPFRP